MLTASRVSYIITVLTVIVVATAIHATLVTVPGQINNPMLYIFVNQVYDRCVKYIIN